MLIFCIAVYIEFLEAISIYNMGKYSWVSTLLDLAEQLVSMFIFRWVFHLNQNIPFDINYVIDMHPSHVS